jgi:hypothetical protein
MGLFDGLFGKGSKNPADSAMPYLNQIPGATSGYFQPYINAGQYALPTLQGQYNQLLGSPGAKLNEIGGQFQQSPGFQFALQQALQGAGHAAAAGGMAGSPQHEQQNMGLATDLANQDYYNWLGHATGLYNQGLAGEQGLASGGLQAGSSMADMIAQTLAQQANLSFNGQQQQNQNKSDMWGNIFKGAGSLAAFNPWGVFGNI